MWRRVCSSGACGGCALVVHVQEVCSSGACGATARLESLERQDDSRRQLVGEASCIVGGSSLARHHVSRICVSCICLPLSRDIIYLPPTISSVLSAQYSTPPMWLVELVGEVAGMQRALPANELPLYLVANEVPTTIFLPFSPRTIKALSTIILY